MSNRISLQLMTGLVFWLATPLAQAQDLECLQSGFTADGVSAWRLAAATALSSDNSVAATVAGKIKQCFGTQVPACVQRSLDYATRHDVAWASQDVTIDQAPQKRPPEELLVPGATGLEYLFPEKIEEIAAQRGWLSVRYKSRHAGGFDTETPSLLMVYVPGDKVTPPVPYDRWLNFALPADGDADAMTPKPQAAVPSAQDYAEEAAGNVRLPHTFTMVTVEKRQGNVDGKVFFQMFRRGVDGSPVFKPQGNSGVGSCYSCHPNGLRAISPLGYHVREGEEQLPEKDWQVVKQMNAAMVAAAGNRVVSWRDAEVDASTGERKALLNPASHGPVVGAVKPLNATGRTQDFINSCMNTRTTVSVTDIFNRAPGRKNIYTLSAQPSVRWEKVRDSMRCASCHNNVSRGALNEQTDWAQIDFKILVDQSMPIGAHKNPLDQGADPTVPAKDDLTADERIALANCLRAEFQLERQQVLSWLTQVSCQ